MPAQFAKLMSVSSIGSNTVTLGEILSGVGIGEGRPTDKECSAVVITTDATVPATDLWTAGNKILVSFEKHE